MAKKNYYAVKSGRKTGIFKTWAACVNSVKGYSGAVFKGFETLAEAEAYLSGAVAAPPLAAEPADCPVAYVDGSFHQKNAIYGFGAAIIQPDGTVTELSGAGNDARAAAEWNIAGELMGAMTAVRWAAQNGYTKLLIKHDYEGIARWATGEWKATKFCAVRYIRFLARYQAQVTLMFEKVPAHAGVYYNELVDRLAKNAVSKAVAAAEGERGARGSL